MALPCFVANWKMNKTVEETLAYLTLLQKRFTHLAGDVPLLHQDVEIILAPPYTALFAAAQRIKKWEFPIGLAAQNISSNQVEGPHTGEISAKMLCGVGCKYVIIGHSERRSSFGESGNTIYDKIQSALGMGINPILCVGESAKERLKGKTLEVVLRQVREGFGGIGEGCPYSFSEWLIAYEPIWAIGSGETPDPHEVEQVHKGIVAAFKGGWGTPRILYGGSVNEHNVADFMRESHIDGMLVGGASLSAETFIRIIQLGMGAIK